MPSIPLSAFTHTLREIGQLEADPEPTDTLVNLGVDSLGVTKLIVALEDLLGRPLPDECLNLEVFESAGSLWSALSELTDVDS